MKKMKLYAVVIGRKGRHTQYIGSLENSYRHLAVFTRRSDAWAESRKKKISTHSKYVYVVRFVCWSK